MLFWSIPVDRSSDSEVTRPVGPTDHGRAISISDTNPALSQAARRPAMATKTA